MLRRTLRRLRLALFALITTAIIALAVLMGFTQLAMPWLVRNPARIEAWLSERLHQPVTIGGVRYVDGGVRSLNNLDLAAGYERVLLIAPMDDPGLAADIGTVEREGGRVEVIAPDEASRAAAGADPLDPSTRTPSANAGLAQGRKAAARIASLWA